MHGLVNSKSLSPPLSKTGNSDEGCKGKVNYHIILILSLVSFGSSFLIRLYPLCILPLTVWFGEGLDRFSLTKNCGSYFIRYNTRCNITKFFLRHSQCSYTYTDWVVSHRTNRFLSANVDIDEQTVCPQRQI